MINDSIQKGGIVCATRGGGSSRIVQLEAIRLARTQKRPLTFIYIVDSNVMDKVDAGLKTAVYNELLWMGKTLLRIAQRRAGSADLNAELVVREGNVQDEISRFLDESEAVMLLLGAPRGATADVVGDDGIETFAASIQSGRKTEIRIVYPES